MIGSYNMSENSKFNVEDIIDKAKSAPRLSMTAMRLMEAMGEKNHSLTDIANIVKLDSLLTGQVLKVVNSADFNIGHEIQTVEDALRYLGDAGITGIIMSQEKIYCSDMSGYLADEGEIWQHSLRTAIASRYFAKNFTNNEVNPQLAYTSGILHDIGKSILSYYLKIEQENLNFSSITNFEEFEKDNFGLSHSEIGYLLAKSWNLPQALCEVIRYHHTPSKTSEESKKLVYTVHVADITAMMSGVGTGVDTLNYLLDEQYIEYLQIGEDELDLAIIEIEKEFTQNYRAILHTLSKGEE